MANLGGVLKDGSVPKEMCLKFPETINCFIKVGSKMSVYYALLISYQISESV